MEATPGIEPGCALLQSAASPLRHVAPSGALFYARPAIGNQPGDQRVRRQSTPAATEIPLGLGFRREFRDRALDVAVARQHPFKTAVQRGCDLGPLFKARE